MTIFSLELLQAISDWQQGGNKKVSSARGEKLKEVCQTLPAEFRESNLMCFRKLNLFKTYVWDLIAEDALSEKISSWTLDSDTAKKFKGGVPLPTEITQQAVILAVFPLNHNVIINLHEIFRNKEFQAAIKDNKSKIVGFNKGIGKYQNDQSEVVIEVEQVTQSDVYSLGGFSSNFDDLLKQAAIDIYGANYSEAQLENLIWKSEKAGIKGGARWLSEQGTKKVLAIVNQQVEPLRQLKQSQN